MSEILDDERLGSEEAGFSGEAMHNIQKVATWTKITAIGGSISLGMIVLILLLFVVRLGGMMPGNFTGLFIGIAVLAGGLGGFVLYLLLGYSKNTQLFAQGRNSGDYETATAKRKTYWIVIGVLTILSLLSTLGNLSQLS